MNVTIHVETRTPPVVDQYINVDCDKPVMLEFKL
jgi:hypothetical protein